MQSHPRTRAWVTWEQCYLGKEKAGNKVGEWEERKSQKGQRVVNYVEDRLVVFAQALQTADVAAGKL